MEKTKVLIVGFTGGVGGVESFILNLCKNIDYDKFEIDLLVHEKINKKYQDEIDRLKINVKYIDGIKKNPLKFVKNIFKFYNKNNYHVVHLNECGASFFVYALPVLFNRNINFIVHSHNGDSFSKKLHYLIRPFQNARANKKWACSEIAAQWMYGKTENDYKIIKNGIQLSQYVFDNKIRNEYRQEYNLQSDFVIISVARFSKQKNHIKMIDIFNNFHKANKNSRLILIGDGETKNDVIEYISKLKLNDCVSILGLRKDVKEFLCAADLFLLPSLYEGLPYVSLEAQATSLPILASDTISKEIEITDLVFWENLNSPLNKWVEKIYDIQNKKIDRNNNCAINKLQKAGFDMKEVCDYIMHEYERK